MRIGILGWGSLVYDWRCLSLEEPVEWGLSGLRLPIEFSRVSRDGRLTAVIDEACGTLVPTRIATSRRTTFSEAINELKCREGNTFSRWIGSLARETVTPATRSGPRIADGIREWLKGSDFDGVIWSDMPPHLTSVDDVVTAFDRLAGEVRLRARDYIAWAPPEVRTRARTTLESRGMLDDAGPVVCQLRP